MRFKAGGMTGLRGISALLPLLMPISCSVIQPDHYFSERILHSYAPGSWRQDSLAVIAILEANDISTDSFAAVALTGDDLRIHALNLSKRQIDTIPDIIGRMGALQNLNLSHNLLNSLPDSIVRLSIFTYVKTGGPCGSGNCEWTYTINGLSIDHNRFCSVTPAISSWLDRQFNQFNHLSHDTTQICTLKQ